MLSDESLKVQRQQIGEICGMLLSIAVLSKIAPIQQQRETEAALDHAVARPGTSSRTLASSISNMGRPGKSTIANLTEGKLHALGHYTYLLKGDNLVLVNRNLGFLAADRVNSARRGSRLDFAPRAKFGHPNSTISRGPYTGARESFSSSVKNFRRWFFRLARARSLDRRAP